MCRRRPPPQKRRSSSSLTLLLTHDSFVFPHLDAPDKDDDNKRDAPASSSSSSSSSSSATKKTTTSSSSSSSSPNPHLHGLGGPSLPSTVLTVAFYVLLLFAVEHAVRHLVGTFAHVDPLLQIERNRHVLARHIGVDFVSLVVCAYVAIVNRRACQEMIDHGMSLLLLLLGRCRRGGSGGGEREMGKGRGDDGNGRAAAAAPATTTTTIPMCGEAFEERIFKYHPGSQRLVLFFFVYQVKNMHDTIYWNDGIEFVLHHILAGAAAWGGMYPGCCHFYALFYFGFSEISTAILCLLANFDPVHGIVGLDEAFPKTKLVLGAMFVVSFVVCRLVMWPFATYYFARDTMRAIKSDVPRATGRRGYLWVIYCCCVGLSLIQLLFAYMIVKQGREEIAKFMST
ncbi:hypothetical protein ACHAW5_007675 [Stephanodiscus triporus]|uniref:TLC domain-containing protein n=1 Tax=Stephanodiscus triporus TaxID=2934178 RepID=A0ABD3R3W7_9STRA